MTKKKIACFPDRNSVVPKKFFEKKPQREERKDWKESDGESKRYIETAANFEMRLAMYEVLQDAEIDIVMVPPETDDEWTALFDLWWSRDKKRRLDLEREGQAVPNADGPMLKEMREMHRNVVKVGVRAVRCLRVGAVASEDLKTGEEIAAFLEAANLLADASRMVREAQTPTPTQLEH